MPKVRISESAWPIVQVSWPPLPDVSTIDDHFDDLKRLVVRGERHAIVVDLTRLSHQTPALRRRAEERLRAFMHHAPRLVAAIGFVVTSRLAWATITAVHWRAPLPVPMRAFVVKRQAMLWLESVLTGAPPPRGSPGRTLPQP